MPQSLYDLLPDADAILEMEPEELAGYFLRLFSEWCSEADQHKSSHPSISSYKIALPNWVEKYPSTLREEVSRAFMEAWQWLENQGFVAPEPGEDHRFGKSFLTRRARKVAALGGVVEFLRTVRLQRDALHPALAEKVWPTYIRGDMETSVFQAFKEVEIAVRKAAGFDNTRYGTEMGASGFRVD